MAASMKRLTSMLLRALSRLNVLALLADQFRHLTSMTTQRPALFVRAVIILIGPIMFGVSYWAGWQMQTVGELVSALGLLAGVFLSAFAVVFGLRVNLAARPTKAIERRTARLMDESALTVLSAGLLSGVDSIWLGALSVSIPKDQPASVFATGVTVGISSLVVVYFFLSVRRMHKLYTDTFPQVWTVRAVVEGPGEQSKSEAAATIDSRRRGGSG
ncbi:hypothetical protein [Pseudarthrobacter scleromae]|jgi:hypothetical protein|uniref:hypothetical protein n=1 Tax=Pseudarthrobacter scleromae TaxID=158897 RepID=UPI003D033F79